ncbi:SAM-dependent methyltransferase [uncultured Desulfosarcina sp.]|uniref:SAM-dependent methyltransferase n=1 Tax=uncultured Desulfosarcina sp. TaxID=218289 RepID=UPI0029C7336C|nr:SAM-dependent methyltransferase [uncultured Desulfosarcina sp.]
MKNQEPSRSAGIIAAHRTMESSKDEHQRVCYDPYARDFLPPGFTVIGPHDIPEDQALLFFKALVPGFHEFFIARTRYIDDHLQDCLNNGLEQLVILGAGYDSRAYRFNALTDQIKVFEVDRPATQEVKKAKVFERFKALPAHVRYIPVDFVEKDFQTGLLANGYDRQLKTLFIWEGVTMYADAVTVEQTLDFIANNVGNGSGLIFDYTYPEVLAGTLERKEAKEWFKISQKSDEPLLFGISRDNIEKFLTDRGFSNVVSVSSEYFNAAYFTGVNQDRESTPVLSLAHAQIKN